MTIDPDLLAELLDADPDDVAWHLADLESRYDPEGDAAFMASTEDDILTDALTGATRMIP